MEKAINLTEKYERNGWPSLKRPDLKPPEGWSLSLITSLERIRSHALSPDGVVEGIEREDKTTGAFLMLVQWHPERMRPQDSSFTLNIKESFIEAVRKTY